MTDDPPGPDRPHVERRPGSAAGASEAVRGTARSMPSGHTDRPAGRRSGGQRALIALGAVLSVIVLVIAVTVGYFNWRLGQINRIDLGLSSAPTGKPENYLVVGSDSRAGITANSPDAGAFLNDQAYKNNPNGSGQRSDTIMVLRVDPTTRTARLLSFPRDLYVPISGKNRSDKINAAFGIGVPTLIATIQDNFGITINHYLEVDFVGFQKLVDAMGGVTLYFDKPMWDSHTGLDISTVGCHQLDGVQALAFARSRYLWYNTLGRDSVDTSSLRYLSTSQMHANGWQQDGTSDLGRISRQQLLIRTAIPQAERAAFRSPTTLDGIMRSVVSSVTVDSGLSTTKLIALANQFRHFGSQDLTTSSYPGIPEESPTAGSILRPDVVAAKPIMAAFLGETDTNPEAQVSIRVLNASGVDHQAANVAGALQRVGFSIDKTGDAAAQGIGPQEKTQIRYAPANEAAAVLVARHLSGPVELVPVAGSTAPYVEVVTGKSFTTVSTVVRDLAPGEQPPTTTGGA
ncbi:MAG: LCP family protein, partial [Actinobacteria bacterium]|nr:LCP family protein [Actinomycetota bacterium]